MVEARLAGLREVAKVLGVSGNQVYMWHRRRASTGFPESIASTLVPQYPGDKRRTPLFDLNAVVEWRSAYTPYGCMKDKPRRDDGTLLPNVKRA